MFDHCYYYLINDYYNAYYAIISELFLRSISKKKDVFILYSKIYIKYNFRMYRTGFG